MNKVTVGDGDREIAKVPVEAHQQPIELPAGPVGVGDDQRRDIGQTKQPRRRHRGPLLIGEDRRADVAGERFDMGIERRHLESDAAGIRLVGEEEIDKRGGLERAEVAVAIGHRAVGDLQEHLVDPLLVGPRRDDGAAEEMDHAGGPLEAATHVEESPAGPARHAFSAETGKGGEVEDQHVEERKDVPIMDEHDRSPADPGAEVGQPVAAEPGEDLPRIDRDPIADDAGHLPHGPDRGRHARGTRLVEHQRLHLGGDLSRRFRPARLLPLRPDDRGLGERGQQSGDGRRAFERAL